MADRVRNDWKGKHDALVVEISQLQQELRKVEAERDQLHGTIETNEEEIERLKKAVHRARAEGLKGAAEFLLSSE